jgi:hypothetical protein
VIHDPATEKTLTNLTLRKTRRWYLPLMSTTVYTAANWDAKKAREVCRDKMSKVKAKTISYSGSRIQLCEN